MNKTYQVAAYLRLSQEDEDKDISDSIISQKNIIEKKVQELGKEFRILDYYIDDGYTGLNTNRPSFQKMLEDIEKGTINCIITKDLSRLSRNSFEANYYIELYFLEKNIRYISVLDNVDTGIKNANNDMIQFKTLINDWYSKDISRKIKSSLWARKEKGMFMGAIAPYGYEKSKRDKHKLIINNMEAINVKRIYEEYNNGKRITQIIQGLQDDKIPSPSNNVTNGETKCNWRVETIKRILTNKVYLGHIEYGKRINLSYKSKKVKYIPKEEWKISYNMHEPIISEELFNKVQKQLDMNKTIKRKKHDWNLNGLVKCKECKGKMTLKVEYKRACKQELQSKKICCLNGLKRYIGKDCIRGSKGLDEEILEQIIYENLKQKVKKLDRKRIGELVIKKQEQISENKSSTKVLEKELAKVEKAIKILYLDYKEGLLDKSDYKKYYNDKVNEKNRIIKQLQNLEKHSISTIETDKMNENITMLLNIKNWNREILLELIHDIQIDKDNQIYINYRYDI